MNRLGWEDFLLVICLIGYVGLAMLVFVPEA